MGKTMTYATGNYFLKYVMLWLNYILSLREAIIIFFVYLEKYS